MKKYLIQDKEAGNIIDIYKTLEEAKKTLEQFEKEDKENNCYTEDFYEIISLEEEEN